MRREINEAVIRLLRKEKIPFCATDSGVALLRRYFKAKNLPAPFTATEDELIAQFITLGGTGDSSSATTPPSTPNPALDPVSL